MRIYGTESNLFILAEIGKRIKDIRIDTSLTQYELAERAGVSPRTIERLENGENIKIENLLNVLRSLNLLQNLEILVPERPVLPTELHDRGGKRKRASKQKNYSESEWKWGDES